MKQIIGYMFITIISVVVMFFLAAGLSYTLSKMDNTARDISNYCKKFGGCAYED